MDDKAEDKMMEWNHTWRLMRAAGICIVAVVAIIATCCVWFPWDPPALPAKTEAEECVALCGTRPVTRYVAHGRTWSEQTLQYIDAPTLCECAGKVVTEVIP